MQIKCRSKKILLFALPKYKGFSLPEVVAALIILALISSSVLVVVNRCMASAADSVMRMRAFEAARENMEALLSSESIKETVEYGSVKECPGIQWQTVVEMFYEPITARMWIQAVCSAEYTDTKGEVQTVELTHWLTDLTEQQVLEIIEQMEEERKQLAEQGEDELDQRDKLNEKDETEKEKDDVKRIGGRTLEELVEIGFPQELLERFFSDR